MVICGVIFVNEEVEEAIREIYNRYNPIASYVRPHLTLLFPLETDLKPRDIHLHFEAVVSGADSFDIGFDGVKLGTTELLIYLEVSQGAEQLRLLNNELYGGPFKRFLRKDLPFYPHLTLGRFEREADIKRAYHQLRDFGPTPCFSADKMDLLERKAPHQWETTKSFYFGRKESWGGRA